jgi:hypothetical protein
VRWRRWIAATAALALIVTGLLYGRQAWHAARLLYWQRQCLNYAPPPTQVVYEESFGGGGPGPPQGDFADLSTPDRRCFSRRRPRCWDAFEALSEDSIAPSEPILFLHRLRTKSGVERLVVVTRYLWPPQYASMLNPWHEYAFSIATYRTAPEREHARTGPPRGSRLEELIEYGSSLRFYAGQLDAADPSHFTIDYEIDGQRGTIDGRLSDDSSTDITIRDGPASRPLGR